MSLSLWYGNGETTEMESEIRDESIAMLVALTRAFNDVSRPNVRAKGIEERDLAFEAGLLEPFEVEMKIYSTQKRNRILKNLRMLEGQGWVELHPTPPTGAYHVFLNTNGEQYVLRLMRPFWQQQLDRIKARWKNWRMKCSLI